MQVSLENCLWRDRFVIFACDILVLLRSRDSSVGIATLYGLYGKGAWILVGACFRTCPDRQWGPPSLLYKGADKSLARPGRKQANVSVRMAWISFGALPCRGGKKLDDSSRLDVVEIARVRNMLPSFFRPGRAKDLSASLYNGYRVFFSRVKRPENDVDHRIPSSAEVEERVDLYLYLSSGPSWLVLGWPFLTPWCRVFLEKLTGLQLVKKFPAFHGTRRFITALTSVRHLSLSWVSPI